LRLGGVCLRPCLIRVPFSRVSDTAGSDIQRDAMRVFVDSLSPETVSGGRALDHCGGQSGSWPAVVGGGRRTREWRLGVGVSSLKGEASRGMEQPG
ncbi:MAG: hypothetical protein ACYTAO_23640, partial [Planctomycetota bacterium]